MRIARQLQLSAVFLLAFAPVSSICASMDDAPPKELIQYIHDARLRGIQEDSIKRQAIAAGWTPALINAAITYDKISGGSPLADGQDTHAASPSTVSAETKLGPVGTPAGESRESPNAAAGGGNPGSKGGAAGIPVAASTPQDYQIAPGDELQISVWKEPEASVPSEIVRPDGKITVPLIKEIEVAGLTPKQVEDMVTERLGKFISQANVSVVITSMAPKSIYVSGAVKKEGPVVYVAGMTVLQALSEAGGLNDYAKRKKIYVLHTENGRTYRSDFNYDEVLRGERMEQNIVLLPNDTIVIPH